MTKHLNIWVVVVAVACAAAVIGCQGRKAMTANPAMTDDRQLVLAVGSRINMDPMLDEMPIGVAAYRGEITLSGAVNNPMQKKHAEQVARSVSGVKDVNNLLVEP